MQYNILIQNPIDNQFTASVIGVPDCVAIGATEVEALDKAKVLLEEQFAKGKIVTVNVPSSHSTTIHDLTPGNQPRRKGDFSTLPGCGIFKDDPTFDDFIERMAEYRAQFDADAGASGL